MELRKTKLYNAICSPDVSIETVWDMFNDFITTKKNINLQDHVTGKTFMHILAENGEKYTTNAGVSVVYLVASSGAFLDIADAEGDTCLHASARLPGTYRLICALMRCGADPLRRNKDGNTAEDIIKLNNLPNCNETLYWLRKFKTGLYNSVTAENPDLEHIERLLKGWCRTRVYVNGNEVNLTSVARAKVAHLLENYEKTNEFAIAMLAGKLHLMNNGISVADVDINTKDHMYQASFPNSPEVPRPLIAAVWEQGRSDSVDFLLSLGVDTTTLQPISDNIFEKEPLFFHLLCKDREHRPPDSVVHKILIASDISVRNQHGQTLLFKAIECDYSEVFIRALFKYGVDIAARDRKGRTAYDYADYLKKTKYFDVLDDYIICLLKEARVDLVESLLLQGYDHILDITDRKGFNIFQIINENCIPSKEEVIIFLHKIPSIQRHLELMFRAAESGLPTDLRKLISRKFSTAQDKCGRTVLHRAILKKSKHVIKFLAENYTNIIDIPDNMGMTPLHYAYLLLDSKSLLNYLLFKGADPTVTDVAGRVPGDYVCDVVGKDAYFKHRKELENFSMEVYLTETNFERSLLRAVKKGDLGHVKQLIEGLKEKGDINRYTDVLFQCVDTGRQNIAVYLIRSGMRTDIYKQYEECSSKSSACAMYTCDHIVTSLYARAKQLECHAVLETMDELGSGKNNAVVDGRPTVKVPSTMDQFAILGLV